MSDHFGSPSSRGPSFDSGSGGSNNATHYGYGHNPISRGGYRPPAHNNGGRYGNPIGRSRPNNASRDDDPKRPRRDDYQKDIDAVIQTLMSYPKTDQADDGFTQCADQKLETARGNFITTGHCPSHLQNFHGCPFFKNKNPSCGLGHSPLARLQVLSVKNICPTWAKEGFRAYRQEVFENKTVTDVNGAETVIRTSVGTKMITAQECCGQWGNPCTLIHPGLTQYAALKYNLDIQWEKDKLYLCNAYSMAPPFNELKELQRRQDLLDHYQSKALPGISLRIQQAFHRREEERIEFERHLSSLGYLHLVYPTLSVDCQYPERGFSDKIWYHNSAALLDGPPSLKGYPYGDGYGTMEVWNFLLETGAIAINPTNQLWDVTMPFMNRLPYGIT